MIVQRAWAELRADPARLGMLGMLGAGYFVATVVVLHLVESEFDPVDHYISDYAVGDFGFLMRSAFFAAGIGTLALARGFSISLAPGRRARSAIILITVAGVGFLVAGAFNGNVADEAGEIEYTAAGIVHTIAGVLLFFSLTIAAFLLRGVFARDARWAALSRSELWFAIALFVALAWGFATPEGGPVGVPQRVFAAILMGWLIFLGSRLRRLTATP